MALLFLVIAHLSLPLFLVVCIYIVVVSTVTEDGLQCLYVDLKSQIILSELL